jgi:hypothetical protein
MDTDGFAGTHPDGLVERGAEASHRRAPASYAPAVPRLRRRLPAAPGERRTAPRPDGQPWRGRLVDLRQ